MSTRTRLAQAAFALVLTAAGTLCLAADADEASTSGSCARPVEEAPTSAVSLPAYAEDTVDASVEDSREAAAIMAWKAYQDSIVDGLTTSADPRDWAIATLLNPYFSEQNAAQRENLLERAVIALPDDALVQWTALIKAHGSGASVAAPLQALQRIEPDNAAVWAEALTPAMQHKDSAAVDEALSRMASSTHFDEHFAAIMKVMVAAYQRYPVPDEIGGLAAQMSAESTKEIIPYVSGMAVASAFVLPTFQDLLSACRVNPATGENSWRAGDCAKIGRLLATHGDTLITSRIGFSVLRVSLTFGAQDQRNARNLDWLWHQEGELASIGNAESAAKIIAKMTDWWESGSEIESIRRELAREGHSLVPPADWADDSSPFSTERLRADQERLSKAALDN